jgi:hypothetical protein
MFKAMNDAKGRMVYRAVVKKELEAWVVTGVIPDITLTNDVQRQEHDWRGEHGTKPYPSFW